MGLGVPLGGSCMKDYRSCVIFYWGPLFMEDAKNPYLRFDLDLVGSGALYFFLWGLQKKARKFIWRVL